MSEITVAEAYALDALPWRERRRRILSGTDLKERLPRFEAAVHDSGIDPLEGDLPAARAGKRDHRAAQLARVREHPAVAAHPALAEALAASSIRLADVPAWLEALDVVSVLLTEPVVERDVLSAQLFGGDAHMLDPDTKVERLVRGLLDRLDGTPGERSVRELWLGWGVETDPLSLMVLTLNLGAEPDTPLGAALATLHGGRVVLTLVQLEESNVAWTPRTCSPARTRPSSALRSARSGRYSASFEPAVPHCTTTATSTGTAWQSIRHSFETRASCRGATAPRPTSARCTTVMRLTSAHAAPANGHWRSCGRTRPGRLSGPEELVINGLSKTCVAHPSRTEPAARG